MSVEAKVYLRSPVCERSTLDPEWQSIVQQIDALDQFLRVQNLRRTEEESLLRLLDATAANRDFRIAFGARGLG